MQSSVASSYKISGMTCSSCVATVQHALSAVKGVQEVKVSLQDSLVHIVTTDPIPISRFQDVLKGYSYAITDDLTIAAPIAAPFWGDIKIWKRASFNTLNCLIGCSIGDFGIMIYLQAFHPATSMTSQMILATLAGLATSVSLETVLLRSREKFNWKQAFQTALSMSFISMVAMELVMNATDFMITGGKAAFGNPMYWTALIAAMSTGFLAPLPYNYFKLKKYNLACH